MIPPKRFFMKEDEKQKSKKRSARSRFSGGVICAQFLMLLMILYLPFYITRSHVQMVNETAQHDVPSSTIQTSSIHTLIEDVQAIMYDIQLYLHENIHSEWISHPGTSIPQNDPQFTLSSNKYSPHDNPQPVRLTSWQILMEDVALLYQEIRHLILSFLTNTDTYTSSSSSSSTTQQQTSEMTTSTESVPMKYGVMFDAGSTGSRIHIYNFVPLHSDKPLSAKLSLSDLELRGEVFEEVKPGLSHFINELKQRRLVRASQNQPLTASEAARELQAAADQAAQSLLPLIEEILTAIPPAAYPETGVSLRATAGLRLLGVEESNAILNSIRKLFRQKFHAFKNWRGLPGEESEEDKVKIITGTEEGTAAWLTVNYLLGYLDTHKLTQHSQGKIHATTAAIMDLGGASTQLVYAPASMVLQAIAEEVNIQQVLYPLPLPATNTQSTSAVAQQAQTLWLYEKSHLNYGLMEARRRAKEVHYHHSNDQSSSRIQHPCFHPKYEEVIYYTSDHEQSKSTSSFTLLGQSRNFDSCYEVVQKLFNKDQCPWNDDEDLYQCAFDGVFHFNLSHALKQPTTQYQKDVAPYTHQDIYAFSYFYDRVTDFFAVHDKDGDKHANHLLSRDEDGYVLNVGTLRYLANIACSETTEEAKDHPALCFDLSYAYSLLSYGYELDDTHKLHIKKKINGVENSWCLGLVLKEMLA